MEGAEPPRQPNDLQGLLRLCMETAEYEGPSRNELNPLDPDRQAWLSEALHSMSTDVVQEMKKAIEIVTNGLKDFESGTRSKDDIKTEIDEAVEILMEYVGNIDYSTDFFKIGGFQLFSKFLNSCNDELKISGAELLAEAVQNHVVCQKAALEMKLLPKLIYLLDNDKNPAVRVKMLYAISCLIRENQEAQNEFENSYDGFSVLLRAMQSNDSVKIRIKSSFLISSLCREQPKFRETLYKMGLVEQIVALLHTPHDESHEFLLSALYGLITEHEASKNECHRKELQLETLLKERLEIIKGKPEFLEEEEYCKRLLNLLFQDQDQPETER